MVLEEGERAFPGRSPLVWLCMYQVASPKITDTNNTKYMYAHTHIHTLIIIK